jgi:hypothetical protein
MRYFSFVRTPTLMLSLALSLAACANRAATAPVPGSLNTYDAYAFRVLADTQAALNAFKADVASGKVAGTPAIVKALNAAISDYDLANSIYQAWHAAGATGSTSALAVALTNIQTSMSELVGGVK